MDRTIAIPSKSPCPNLIQLSVAAAADHRSEQMPHVRPRSGVRSSGRWCQHAFEHLAPSGQLAAELREGVIRDLPPHTFLPRRSQPWREEELQLSLAEPVAEAIRRDDVEHPPRDVGMLLDVELRDLLQQPVRLELVEQRLQPLHVECTAVLR